MKHASTLAAAIWLLVLAVVVTGQRGRGANDHTPLGGLGCEGDVEFARRGQVFKIATLEDGGPAARGGLRVGDLILALNGKKMKGKGDPVLAFSRQVEVAEATKDGKLPVVYLRDGQKLGATLEVMTLGPHSKSCPVACKKCATVRNRAMKFLVQHQAKSGGWATQLGGQNGMVVVSTLAGLAVLGSGKHRECVGKARDYVATTCGAPSPFDRMRPQGGANWNQSNWQLGYAPFFLTAFRQNAAVKAKLREIAGKLVANQETSGGYAHGPGGPNALDYLELEIVSNYALASLGLMRDHGIAVDEAAVDRAIDYVRSCASGGGVAYSTRKGQAGHGEPGRTAGAWFAFYRNGLGKSKKAKQMRGFFRRGMKKLPGGHVSPMMHILAGALCARAAGGKLWKDFWREYRPYMMGSRLHSGGFAARPTKESRLIRSNTDRTLGPNWTTATYAIILNMALDEKAYPHLFRPPQKRPKP